MTGLEIDGPLEDCIVEYEDERKRTDESGNVAFDVGTGPYELALEKEGWQNKVETVDGDETGQEVHVPMHVTETIDA